MTAFQELLNLLLPTRCSICGLSGAPICRACGDSFSAEPRLVRRETLVGFSACEYDEASIKLLKDFKEHNQTSLSGFIGQKMAPCLGSLFDQARLPGELELEPEQRLDRELELEQRLDRELEPLLVPIPSSRENFIKRGYSPGVEIARALSSQVRRSRAAVAKSGNARQSRRLPVVKALGFSRSVADQSKLKSAERYDNLAGAMVASASVAGRQVVLVDDIVTTGATLLEAARAVNEAGGVVLGFLTFSETLRKTQAKI